MSAHAGAPNLRGAHVFHHVRGLSHGRLRRNKTLLIFAITFAVIIGVGAGLIALVAPSTAPLCQPYRPCGAPPASTPLVNQNVWKSSTYGFSLDYPGQDLSIANQSDSGVALAAQLRDGTTATVIVQGVSASQASPQQALQAQVSNLQGNLSGITTDPNPADQLLGSGVGHVSGVGGAFVGTLTAPQGASQTMDIASQAATDGHITVTTTVVAAPSDATPIGVYQLADAIINSVHWPSGA